MAHVTIQVLEGLERGSVYENLALPITLGREDDNHVRLNDERVSRFHAKIQQDDGHLILTDLDSTNGTRVNGHPVQMRVLRIGDQLTIGRCLLVVGSPEEIAAEYALRAGDSATLEHGGATLGVTDREDGGTAPSETMGHDVHDAFGDVGELFPAGPPEVPQDLRPATRAQVSDAVAWVHEQLSYLIDNAVEDTRTRGDTPAMRVDMPNWQRVLQLEMQLANWLKALADPDA